MSLEIKDISQAFHDLDMSGRNKREIEAFVINSDDLAGLFKERHSHHLSKEYNNRLHGSGDLRIFGIKVIGSQHIQKGSIFKIFKNDFDPSVPNSGSVCFPEHLRIPTITEEKRKNNIRHSTTRKIQLD